MSCLLPSSKFRLNIDPFEKKRLERNMAQKIRVSTPSPALTAVLGTKTPEMLNGKVWQVA